MLRAWIPTVGQPVSCVPFNLCGAGEVDGRLVRDRDRRTSRLLSCGTPTCLRSVASNEFPKKRAHHDIRFALTYLFLRAGYRCFAQTIDLKTVFTHHLPPSRQTPPAFHAPTDPSLFAWRSYPPHVTQAVEDCELFTLQRSKFREMLALSVSASLVQRVAWMQATPELVRDRHDE